MAHTQYRTVSLAWQPGGQQTERNFYVVTLLVSLLMAVLAVVFTSIDVPQKERKQTNKVPDRIAQYISERPKPVIPKPKVIPPPPKPKPKVVRRPESQAKKNKPLTKTEKVARAKAAETGLLALGNEIADLIDTSEVNALLSKKVHDNAGGAKSARLGTAALTDGVGSGVASISAGDHLSAVGSSKLSRRDIAQVKQSLFKQDITTQEPTEGSLPRERLANVRSEEDITITFDQNKGTLYSIYNRERRKNPSLRGKIIFEISIDPNGKVIAAKIISSALNDAALERRLLARIKHFNFGVQAVELVTVTFPVEFLPS